MDKGIANSVCKACEFGRYADSVRSSSCVNCVKGKHVATTKSTSSSDCKACPSGRFGDEKGLKLCKDCYVGRYMTRDFTGQTLNTDCTKCEQGRYENQVGQLDRCKYCPIGKFMPAGTQESTSLSSCQLCPSGKFQNMQKMTSCESCVKGKYQEPTTTGAVKSDDCLLCQAGYWSDESALSSKHDPRPNDPVNDNPACKACGGGTFPAGEGLIIKDDCGKCSAGLFSLGLVPPACNTKEECCKDCVKGTMKPKNLIF